jgi:CheY-like chemotaxis protein
VLVIEDDGADQTQLAQVLRSAGYQVEFAERRSGRCS